MYYIIFQCPRLEKKPLTYMEELNVLPSEMLLGEEQHTIVYIVLPPYETNTISLLKIGDCYLTMSKIKTFATYIFSVQHGTGQLSRM